MTKNRRPVFQPLPESLLQRLIDYSAGKPAGASLLATPSHPARALQKDLFRAGIPLATPEGKVDFHALRVACDTLVIEAGANPKEAMAYMRHSTPDLTLNVYGRARANRLAELVESVDNRLACDVSYVARSNKQAAGAEGLVLSEGNINRLQTMPAVKAGISIPPPPPILSQGQAQDTAALRPRQGTAFKPIDVPANDSIAIPDRQQKDTIYGNYSAHILHAATLHDVISVVQKCVDISDETRQKILAMLSTEEVNLMRRSSETA